LKFSFLNSAIKLTMFSRLFLLLLLFTGTPSSLKSQQTSLGSWNILNVKYALSDKWSFFGEGQIRSLKFYDHFHYYEVKGGANYELKSGIRLTLGAGSYQTYREGGDFVLPKNNDEFRIWPQVLLSQKIGKFKIEQRYRIENRFTSSGYRNRYRYRLGLTVPLYHSKKDFSVALNLNNELFFTNKEPYFERNRVLGGFNIHLNKTSGIQVAYLHQFDYKINDEIGRDFFVIGYYFEFTKSAAEDDSQKD
jgi:hypothetical protein